MRKFARTLVGSAMWCACTLVLGISTHAQSSPPAKDSNSPPTRDELLAALERLSGLVEKQSRELEGQRTALREQQKKTAALEQRLERLLATAAPGATLQPALATTRAANPLAPAQEQQKSEDLKLLESQLDAVADSQAQLAARVGQVETNAANAQRTADGKFRQLGNFTFSGDIRLRYEPFFGGGPTSSPTPESRHRPRFRARFNANAKFNDEWSGGLTLASGDQFDPISTNQTETNFFERKVINIDRAFVEYKPIWAKALLRNSGEFTLTGGKFGYTWYRTEMTLDNDLNPEGISEVLDFKVATPLLKRLVFVGFQLPFNEVTSGADSFMHGGQFQSHWQWGSRVKFAAYIGFYDWNRADPIRPAQTARLLVGSTNNNAATATQFASKFGILDTIARWDVSTWSTRWPLMFQLNYANNTRACTNLVNIAPPQPVCNPRDREAYWAEFQLGQTREPRDLRFGYTFARIEREAVLGAFNFSDLRSPSNVASHRLNFEYQAYRNITLGFTGLLGRQLTTATSAEERYLKRLQMDLSYKF